MKIFNEEIRKNNRSESKSMEKITKIKPKNAKSDARMNYWNSIKDQVASDIIKTKLQGGASTSQLKIKKDEIMCEHKCKISPEQI